MPPRALKKSLRPFICPCCRHRARAPAPRRLFSATTTSLASHETATPDLERPTTKYARLTNRSLIKLSGRDASKFLFDLLPAKILDLSAETATRPIYTAFLNAHGRVLNDVFVYPPSQTQVDDGAWLVEVDAESAAALMQHLKKHKLRSKVVLERVSQEALEVYYTWPKAKEENVSNRIGGPDPRPGMGSRWIMAPEQASKDTKDLSREKSCEVPLEEYTIHRMLNGIAEGQGEIIGTSALPMESNIDFFYGIDFHKGCYLGQELTIRTHHTGVVRKRILPCQIYNEGDNAEHDQETPIYSAEADVLVPPSESNLSKVSAKGKGRSVGKWLGGVGNIGLAICRLEVVTDIQMTGEGPQYNPDEEFKVSWEQDADGKPTKEVRVRPIALPWLRQKITESIERRQRRPKKGEDEEEVE